VSVIPIDDIAYQAKFWCPAGLQIETFGLELCDRSFGCPLRLMSLWHLADVGVQADEARSQG